MGTGIFDAEASTFGMGAFGPGELRGGDRVWRHGVAI